MSWFYHVLQCSDQHQQLNPDVMPPSASESIADAHHVSALTLPATNSLPQVMPLCALPMLRDLPQAPQSAAVPPTLENLSCTTQSAGPGGEHVPVSYVTIQEQRCVLSWFLGWSAPQRERFLRDLLGKAVPGKVCTLLDSLNSLQVRDGLPNIFECQLRLWTMWFESWSEEERNRFLHILEEQDPVFVAHFYKSVAGTAGKD